MANSEDPDLKKPTDLDLHCLQRQGISGFSRTRVKIKLPQTPTPPQWSWVQILCFIMLKVCIQGKTFSSPVWKYHETAFALPQHCHQHWCSPNLKFYVIQSTLVISNSKGLSEILRDIRSSTYQVCRIEEKIIWLTTFNKLIGNWTFEVRDILKIQYSQRNLTTCRFH